MTTVPINIQNRIHTKAVRIAAEFSDIFFCNNNLKQYDFRGDFSPKMEWIASNIYIHTNSWHKGKNFPKGANAKWASKLF